MAPVAGGKPAAYAMDAFIEACSGATGAIVSKCVSYPLDLMKTLLASAGPNDTAVGIVTDIVRTKGIIGLYVGIGPKLTKSGVQKFLFFYVYDALLRLFRNLQGTAPNTFWNVIIGFVADFLGAPFVVPLDFITTQVQTTKTGEGTWAIVQRTMKEDGIWKFWDGFSGYVAGSWQPAVQFTFYDQLKAMYLKAMKKASTDDSHASESGLVLAPALTAFEAFTLGAVAKVFSEMITYPTELVRIVQQSSQNKMRDLPFFSILFGVAREEGLFGLYKGIGPQLAQGIVSIGIMFMVKEQVNGTVRKAITSLFGPSPSPSSKPEIQTEKEQL